MAVIGKTNNITYHLQMAMHKHLILEALLRDAPAALEELKGLGIYEPDKQ